MNSGSQDLNPLLSLSHLFDGALPFNLLKEEHFVPGIKALIEKAKMNIQNIKNVTEPRFDNVILALERSSEELSNASLAFHNYESCLSSEYIQKISPQISEMLSAFYSDFSLDLDLFKLIKKVYDEKASLKLSAEDSRLLEKTYLFFVRNGALLSTQQKEEVRQIDLELSKLVPKFSENVLKSTNAFTLVVQDKKDIPGLPESSLEAAAMAAEAKGHPKGTYLFTIQAPSMIPFLTYCSNRELREKIWRASSSKALGGSFDNSQIVIKMSQLREQRAHLLGYASHAHYVLEERMAKTPETVKDFIQKFVLASKPFAMKDLAEVKAFALSKDQISNFMPWDFAYYSEKLKENLFQFTEEDFRPYFKLESCVQGVFKHAEKLYGIKFKKREDLPVYHPEVTVYEVEDLNGNYLGLFYTDFFPRESKKSGAWMTLFRSQGYYLGKIRRPHVSIVCNFTKPTESKPSLLTYLEVKTLFHEFGHALHGLLSDCTHSSLASPNVLWDFVELPSQIMENWVGEEEGLEVFAKHYLTSAPLPKDLLNKLKAAEKFQAGWMCLRQLQLATLDLAWHSENTKSIQDVEQFEDGSLANLRLMPKIPGTNISVSFSHIFPGGYSAGYYSYKWAEVLDADAFEYFKSKGIFSREVAQKFRSHILSKGDTEHPMDLYKSFRGKEPDIQALLRRDGLL